MSARLEVRGGAAQVSHEHLAHLAVPALDADEHVQTCPADHTQSAPPISGQMSRVRPEIRQTRPDIRQARPEIRQTPDGRRRRQRQEQLDRYVSHCEMRRLLTVKIKTVILCDVMPLSYNSVFNYGTIKMENG